jgi:hypothetical protein
MEGTDVNDVACLLRALSSTETTLSTRRNRLRCLSFWGVESRYGIFLGALLENFATLH